MTNVSYTGLSKVRPHKPLLKKLQDHAGRNSQGRITMRHQGGGNKRMYREIEFGQTFLDIPGVVETLEYDPYRSAFIALVLFENKKRAYVIAPQDLVVGMNILTAETAPLKTGNRLKLKNIPIGFRVYNVEMRPGHGGQLARSAGTSLEVLAHSEGYSDLKLSSGEVRRVPSEGFASIGQVSNSEHNLVTSGKAGRSRWLGIRPTTRGKAMNPVDHPYGGGEGSQPRGTRKPKTMWGKVTGGHRTRNKKKWSTNFIIKRRTK